MGMGKVEFIGMMAMLMAINALAIDIMLPGLQQIGASLGVTNENHRQYVISAYLLGFSVSQLFYGPLSDRFGRRKPLLFGLVVYVIAAASAAFVPSFASLLLFRLIQGIGSAATRVITISIVRDVYGGRQMAEVMSLIMMVFMIVIGPAQFMEEPTIRISNLLPVKAKGDVRFRSVLSRSRFGSLEIRSSTHFTS